MNLLITFNQFLSRYNQELMIIIYSKASVKHGLILKYDCHAIMRDDFCIIKRNALRPSDTPENYVENVTHKMVSILSRLQCPGKRCWVEIIFSPHSISCRFARIFKPFFDALKTHLFVRFKRCASTTYFSMDFPQYQPTPNNHNPIHQLLTAGSHSSLRPCWMLGGIPTITVCGVNVLGPFWQGWTLKVAAFLKPSIP